MDLYQEITDTLLAQVDEAGNWKPCWVGASSLPKNGVTGTRYNGINILMLWAQQMQRSYTQDRWATYKQWNGSDCQVRKGERGTTIMYYEVQTSTNRDSGESESYRMIKHFTVFNADQVDGDLAVSIPVKAMTRGQRNSAAEIIIGGTGALILNEGHQPCYVPARDEIRMPLFGQFVDPESYYATMFHELGHWTGAKHRLARDLSTRFKTESYGMEELVAEITSAFVSASIGMTTQLRDDHACYLKGWLETMKKDKSAIVIAAAAASKAADFILMRSRVEALAIAA